jgi:hypothetical protein
MRHVLVVSGWLVCLAVFFSAACVQDLSHMLERTAWGGLWAAPSGEAFSTRLVSMLVILGVLAALVWLSGRTRGTPRVAGSGVVLAIVAMCEIGWLAELLFGSFSKAHPPAWYGLLDVVLFSLPFIIWFRGPFRSWRQATGTVPVRVASVYEPTAKTPGTCPTCHTPNPANSKFCKECGSRL